MLEVKLINPNDEFSDGFPIPFENACNLTEGLELRYRDCKKMVSVDFIVLEDEEEIYKGTMNLGSGKADNLFDHINKILNGTVGSKEQEEQKQSFYEKMYEQLPEHLKELEDARLAQEEELNTTETEDEDKSFKRRFGQKRALYLLCLSSLILMGTTVFNLQSISSQKQALTTLDAKLEKTEKILNEYKEDLKVEKNDKDELSEKIASLEEVDKKIQKLDEKINKVKKEKK